VSVVSAPPGSGKTVLLWSWIGWAGVAGNAAWVPAGPRRRERYRDRDRGRFTGESQDRISVYEVTAAPGG